MFDNPRKELERLQLELLAAEAPEEPANVDTEDLDDQELDELTDWEDAPREPLSRSYTDVTDDTMLWSPEPEPEKEPEEAPEKPQKKHFVGLKFAIALELLGIAALFWWWYLWIR